MLEKGTNRAMSRRFSVPWDKEGNIIYGREFTYVSCLAAINLYMRKAAKYGFVKKLTFFEKCISKLLTDIYNSSKI